MFCGGTCDSRLSSMKIKLFGSAAQTNGLISPGVLLTLSILISNSVPDPFSGTKLAMKADMRRVLILAPGTGVPVGVGVASVRMLAEMFQFGSLVSPALCTCGVAKRTIAESKVKSPWKPT